jgi:hypothetical protein
MIDIPFVVDDFIFRIERNPVIWKYAKYIANICFFVGTLIIISPQIASQSTLPWKLYFVGNLVWALDSLLHKNWAWVFMGGFFAAWDVLLIITRVMNVELLPYFEPAIKIIEKFI